MLYVDSLHSGNTASCRWLLEVLACAKLTDCAGLLELSLELFQSALDVFAFFYWYNNHFLNHPLFLFAVAKVVKYFNIHSFFEYFLTFVNISHIIYQGSS